MPELPPPQNPADGVVATAQGLTDALRRMTLELKQVRAYAVRSRRIIIALAISLVLDIGLTASVSVFAVKAQDATTRANAAVNALHATQVAACQAGNQTRAEEVDLWDHIAAVSQTRKTTPRQRREDEQLLAFIRKIFAPRNCIALYRIRLGGVWQTS
jgi:hypothetical protein